MYLNYKILSKNFSEQYTGVFYQYYIQTVYGDNITMAESILEEEENE